MIKIEDIEKAIEQLSPEGLAKFREWFDAFDARVFDEKIERDARSGKLGGLVSDALADFRAGRAREL
jgi:hypothetical protein